MVTKLLPVRDVTKTFKDRTNLLEVRSSELDEEIKNKQRKLDEIENRTQGALEKERDAVATERARLLDSVEGLRKELDSINLIEKDRKRILLAVAFREDEAQTMYNEAKRLIDTCQEKEVFLDRLRDEYEDKLDAFGEKEELIVQRLNASDKILSGAQLQSRFIAENSRKLSEEVANLLREKEALERIYQERNSDLSLKQIAVEEKEKWVTEERKRIEKEKEALKDKYDTLQRSVQRVDKELFTKTFKS